MSLSGNNRIGFSQTIVFLVILFVSSGVYAQNELRWDQSDQFEIKKEGDKFVTYVVGHVVFITETGKIYCDSAKWIKGEEVTLNGNVLIDDEDYKLSSDSVLYNIRNGEILALGKQVELWSYADSIYASGVHAFYAEQDKKFYMEYRPVMYLGYPDTSNMTQVIANRIDYDIETEDAQALGNVKISSKEYTAQANCAKMNLKNKSVDLFDKPTAQKDESDISGELISIYFEDDRIKTIDVVDSAYGHFNEIVDSTNNYYDESILSGRRITLNFKQGRMNNIVCYDQAYCWYYPSARGKSEKHENSISGDTIKFDISDNQLKQVDVIGGAIGRYIAAKSKTDDSGQVKIQIDTIDYNSNSIAYQILDSLIVLKEKGLVKSGTVTLEAHQIEFDTRLNLIEAFSADIEADTIISPYNLSEVLQPNIIPVKLKDGSEVIYGDYMLYSIDTEKGRIVQSKTNYDQGYYYGEKLYREQEDVFYVKTGRYTTCDADEPHFHFRSNNMKLIEDDKLIAKPVVFYIERIPIFALPYYIFPLKKGRHSGILDNLSFGQFERGERYIKNVGYYWAASEYWDWQAAFDYYEQSQTINFSNRFSFKKRYVLDGYVSGNYTRVTGYNRSLADEFKSTRWTIRGAYNHIFSPTFDIKATADFQSDESFYSDYSQDDSDRINRSIVSQLSFRKRFGKATSISGNASHTENLDQKSRVDYLPNMNFSFPTLYPFGSGAIDESGKKTVKWYHKINFRYSPKVRNYSSRITVIDTILNYVDSSFVTDSAGVTSLRIKEWSDTLSHRSRKEYLRVTHNPSLNLPSVKLGHYLNLVPRFSYNESWAKVSETDQSLAAGIDDAKMFRTYSYSTGVSANTSLYGTLYPNMFGLTGIRHVLTPSVGYSYSPELNQHTTVRSYVGGMAGSSKSSILTFSLRQLLLAKVKHKETEKNYQLLSVNSSFSYNYLNDDRPFSNLSTSFQSNALPVISSVTGYMTHTFYDLKPSKEKFWSPTLIGFQLDLNLKLAGNNFFFDETTRPRALSQGVDSLSKLPQSGGRSGWSFSAHYSYRENRNINGLTKSSFIDFNLSFSLTSNTYITYNQRYRIEDKLTTSNSVNIVRKIHCWTGSLFWVPIGTNRGFGFKLFVTGMPEIKIDNNYSGFTETLQY